MMISMVYLSNGEAAQWFEQECFIHGWLVPWFYHVKTLIEHAWSDCKSWTSLISEELYQTIIREIDPRKLPVVFMSIIAAPWCFGIVIVVSWKQHGEETVGWQQPPMVKM